MRDFRESGIGQVIFAGIVGAIIIAFIASAGRMPSMDDLKKDCVAELGDICIEPREYFAAYGLAVSQVQINEKAAEQIRLKEQIARGLVEREVLLQEAKRLGIGSTVDAVDAELLEGRAHVSLPAKHNERLALGLALCIRGDAGCEPGTIGLRGITVRATKDGPFDFKIYERAIRNATGRSANQFKEMQERELTAERLRELYRGGARVSEEEAYLGYERRRSQATVRFARIETSFFERYLVSPTSEAQAAYEKEHEAELKVSLEAEKKRFSPGCAVVSEITLEKASEETEDQLLERAKKLRPSAERDFERTAREHGVSASARLGGHIGCLDPSFGAGFEEVDKVAKAMTRAGQVSEPVVTARGVHLIRFETLVTEQNAEAVAKSFLLHGLTTTALAQKAASAFAEEVLAQVKGGAKMGEATEQLFLARLKDTAFGRPAAGAPAPEKADDRPKTDISRAFTIEQNPFPEVTSSEPVAQKLFALKTVDEVLPQIVGSSRGYLVIQLKERDLATREKFATEKAALLQGLNSQKSGLVLEREMERLVSARGSIRFNDRYLNPDRSEKSGAPESPSPGG